jgi:glucose-1-phosphate cytidylyltransferase
MKAVILAGGRGTRISEESVVRPKPMITIGGKPILWHIMQIYARHGITNFIVCLGYKGYLVKEYFANYHLHSADMVEIDLATNRIEYEYGTATPWRVTLVETGDSTQTGGRIKRIRRWIGDDDAFCMTYGDGLADIDISGLIRFHASHGKYATMTAVNPPGRFGAVELQGEQVIKFVEKPTLQNQVINGGFFVLSPKVLDYIEGDETVWERQPLEDLATQGQLRAFPHRGFWQPMDTIRERDLLEELWASGKRPWMTGHGS